MSKLHTLVINCECSINDDNFELIFFLGFVIGKPYLKIPLILMHKIMPTKTSLERNARDTSLATNFCMALFY